MIYHAMIEVDVEGNDHMDATDQAKRLAQDICDGSFIDCARVKRVIEHVECARLGCYKRVCYEGAEYCGAACSAQRKEPKCTCGALGPDPGCPVHDAAVGGPLE